jgi:hypothetical protein
LTASAGVKTSALLPSRMRTNLRNFCLSTSNQRTCRHSRGIWVTMASKRPRPAEDVAFIPLHHFRLDRWASTITKHFGGTIWSLLTQWGSSALRKRMPRMV